MRFIGDVHSRYKQYREIIRDCPASIQIGDMGIGFIRKTGPQEGEFWPSPPQYAMVTHECPEAVAQILFGVEGSLKFNIPSRTRQAFQSMFDAHRPELWVFGHWHESRDQVINGTRFICLAELEYKDIELC